MKKSFIIFVAIIALLLVYSVAYTVRFDQTAVVTTFGRASDSSVRNAGDADESGFGFKLPYPIQAVRTYDKRVQVLDDRPEEQQTRDKVAVVVQSYLAWEITDPLAFYRSLGNVETAQGLLRTKLRGASKNIGAGYTFADMTNTDPQLLKLKEMEGKILEDLKAEVEPGDKPAYGVRMVSVGIKRILLAPKTTEAVFERMKKTRIRMAQDTLSSGDAIARAVVSEATEKAGTIKTFADARAREIRNQGEQAAIEYMQEFNKDEEFAIFQRTLETYKAIFAEGSTGKTTMIIDPQKDPLFKFLMPGPVEGPKVPLKAAAE